MASEVGAEAKPRHVLEPHEKSRKWGYIPRDVELFGETGDLEVFGPKTCTPLVLCRQNETNCDWA